MRYFESVRKKSYRARFAAVHMTACLGLHIFEPNIWAKSSSKTHTNTMGGAVIQKWRTHATNRQSPRNHCRYAFYSSHLALLHTIQRCGMLSLFPASAYCKYLEAALMKRPPPKSGVPKLANSTCTRVKYQQIKNYQFP